MDATEKVAQMMIRCGLATGHGDTIDDLIFELEKQIKQLREATADLLNAVDGLFPTDGPIKARVRAALKEKE